MWGPHIKQMIRTLTKNAQHQEIRELESRQPQIMMYRMEDPHTSTVITRTESKDINNLLFDHFILQGGFNAGV